MHNGGFELCWKNSQMEVLSKVFEHEVNMVMGLLLCFWKGAVNLHLFKNEICCILL